MKASDFEFKDAIIDVGSLFDGIEDPLSDEFVNNLKQDASNYEDELLRDNEYCITTEEEVKERVKKSSELANEKELTMDDINSDEQLQNLFTGGMSVGQAMKSGFTDIHNQKEDAGSDSSNTGSVDFEKDFGGFFNLQDYEDSPLFSTENNDTSKIEHAEQIESKEDDSGDYAFDTLTDEDSFGGDFGGDFGGESDGEFGSGFDGEFGDNLGEEMTPDSVLTESTDESQIAEDNVNSESDNADTTSYDSIDDTTKLEEGSFGSSSLQDNSIDDNVAPESIESSEQEVQTESLENDNKEEVPYTEQELIDDANNEAGDISSGTSLFDTSDDELVALEEMEKKIRLEEEEAARRRQEQLEALNKQKEIVRQKLILRKQEELKHQEELKRQEELKKQEELKRQEELKKQEELKRQEELKKQEELKNQEASKSSEETNGDEDARKDLIRLILKYSKKTGVDPDLDDDDDEETLRLKLDIAKLEYKKYLKRVKKAQLEAEKSNEDAPQAKVTKPKNKLPTGIDVANKTVSEHQKELSQYSAMNIEDLFSVVKQYLLAKGVKNSLVPLEDVVLKFGKDNIKRLREKNYIIVIRNGITLGQM
jgi:hypothetical protein